VSEDRNSGFDSHKRLKKKLISPLNQLPVNRVDWKRIQIPEFLWIASLAEYYSGQPWHNKYEGLVNVMGTYVKDRKFVFMGLISDFDKIPKKSRAKIVKIHKDSINSLFSNPVGDILCLYPKCPANWLLSSDWKKDNESKKADALQKLSKLLIKLYHAKDKHAAYVRMMPFKQILKYGKIRFPSDSELVDLLPKYPDNLTEDDKRKCEAYCRTITNMVINDNLKDSNWPEYFWNRNIKLSQCKPENRPSADMPESKKEQEKIVGVFFTNSKKMEKYFSKLVKLSHPNLFNAKKDEVLLGLFSRIVRLYTKFSSTPDLWSADLGRVILRLICDSCITFSYLLEKNDSTLFDKFVDYAEGKEKLLLLKLQDKYPGLLGPTGETVDEIRESLGGNFSPEFIDINLSNWIDISARDMAEECGFSQEYSLVYDPASSDIHGTWTSLRISNLTLCLNPLHGLHRVPSLRSTPLFITSVNQATKLVLKTIRVAIQKADFPKKEPDLKIISFGLPKSKL